ncbi:MAG: hypothetical protein H0V61_10465 [Chitinophagales bacterium]|nr:hypothetical protein [Chitinophagales bacterium]
MRYLIIFFLLFYCVSTAAQEKYYLNINAADKDSGFLTKGFSYEKEFADTTTRTAELKKLLTKLYEKGYLETAYYFAGGDSSTVSYSLFTGIQWQWAKLYNGNIDAVILDRIGFREKLYSGKPFSISQVIALLNEILGYCENNGYPFASVYLDSFKIDHNNLSARIFLLKNKLITIDSIKVQGNVNISYRYLANYLGFRLPSVYQEDLVKKIAVRLKELPFLTEEKPAQILFQDRYAYLLLYLKKKNASNFDFVLGVLPNSNTTGKLLITGDGRMNLINPFGKGESLGLRFNQLQSRTTEMRLQASYPYIFNLPFGIDASFDLYKNDTLYLEVKEQVGIQYLFTGVNYLKIYFRNTGNSILSVDTLSILQTKQLPSYLAFNTNFYGVEYQFERLDYRINPQRGVAMIFSGEAGNRKIKKDNRILQLTDPFQPEFNFSSLYDSVDLKETQFRLTGNIDKFWLLSGRSSFKSSYHGGAILSNNIFENELYHIGGFRFLRGFDEQSIFASQYHVATLEYHYLLSLNSFAYLFFDAGYIENSALISYTSDTPVGFGAGLNFETKAGVFGISYALGRQKDNPIEFRSAKIHFGYVNHF